jgi:hypothetical protein
MRTNEWLEEQLYELWENNFADLPRPNIVLISFGKKAKRQLGCIKMLRTAPTKALMQQALRHDYADDKKISLITITSHFKDETIPDLVVTGTIAHELCHYAHGFNSPLPKLFDHPHKGGVVRRELGKRGLAEQYKLANKWLKLNWVKYLKTVKNT